MPKKIDPELTARAVRLVNEHRGEYTVLLSGMSGHPQACDDGDDGEEGQRAVL